MRRKHRRVRPHWDDCGCPSGAQRVDYAVPSKRTRGWTCIAPTQRGPRFVRAKCAGNGGSHLLPSSSGPSPRDMPPALRVRLLRQAAAAEQLPLRFDPGPDPRQLEIPLRKAKKRRAKLDWDKCKCPSGSEQRVNAKGARSCYEKTAAGGRYVAAICKE